ncbi:exported hypothetical protein [Rubrivivax sp. A210]|uniref:PEP-CTERM sorting domain-containing protein n=1 Tax=Rubrivivax sp. A210 TaxID=2772301 RepID=UPI00191AF695|nr:PEP-CTERM sorting domain-containing protein [Rubrivivax sp. A210]CAD5373222.1 exported hypothetical protein [Rubrivivax sp. A210]
MSRPFSSLSTLALAAAVALAAAAPAQAAGPGLAFNEPIVFWDPGLVTLTLESSSGGFDHVLELADATGPVGPVPLLALTDLVGGQPSASVLGWLPAAVGATVALGNAVIGQEIVLRLTNIGSARFGDVGVVDSQVFTGSASILNPVPGSYYTSVEWISPTQVRVQMEDLFPVDPGTNPAALDTPDLQFVLTLSPVPEPRSWALMLGGLAALGSLARRRRG